MSPPDLSAKARALVPAIVTRNGVREAGSNIGDIDWSKTEASCIKLAALSPENAALVAEIRDVAKDEEMKLVDLVKAQHKRILASARCVCGLI
jgi:hypothetical protein